MTDVTDILRKFLRVPRTHAQGSCLFTRVFAVRAESFIFICHICHLSLIKELRELRELKVLFGINKPTV